MNILYLTPTLPYPPNSGGHKRSLLLLKALAKQGEVTLVSSGNPMADRLSADALGEHCKRVHLIDSKKFGPHSKDNARIGFVERLRRLISCEPWVVEDYFTEEFKSALLSVRPEQYDVIVIRYINVAYCFLKEARWKVLRDRMIVDVDDIWIQMEERRLKTLGFGYVKIRHMIEVFFLRNLYKKLRRVRACFVVSEKDRDYMVNNKFADRVFLLPNVFEVNGSCSLEERRDGVPEMLFCGVLSYPHNEEGIIFFCKEIFPRIRERISDARLTIVGKNPTERIMDLSRIPGVSVVGPVPSMEPYYEKAKISLVPLLNGAGTRVKILEAMAFGRPVVSTSIGAEGLEVTDGEHILIADDPKTFADACIELLKNEGERKRVASNAFKLVKEKYDPGVFYEGVDEAFEFIKRNDHGRR
ncbi:MAG: glycosyltransferase [Candidatus Omnitrophica bacterium]|nr:glycosyltransferase [Candidatus Omnitrophota bacterium]